MTDAVPASPENAINCNYCGYNLVGLDRSGNCPECGRPVASSLHGNLLEYANPEWLGKVKQGVDLLFWAIVLAFIWGLLVNIYSAANARVNPLSPVTLGIQIVFAVVFVAAAFLMTTPEPATQMSESSRSWRKVARASALIAFISGLVSLALLMSANESAVLIIAFIGPVGYLAYLLLIFAMLTYAANLALRLPNPLLADSATKAKWAMVIVVIFLITFGVLAGLFAAKSRGGGAAPSAAGVGIAGVGGCIGALATLFVFLWICRIIDRFRKELNPIVKTAQANADAGA